MHKLVEGLVKEGIIRNPDVSKIMEHVDRKYYAPSSPYYDSPQSIGFGATISAPHMHAWALELLINKLRSSRYALDVGSGTGYLTAAMALAMPEGAKVFGI
jgi:protein-L-isoaspartate(D-aspartate) O-methyltransferase